MRRPNTVSHFYLRELNNSCNETTTEETTMFQSICRFFAKRFIPMDHEKEIADALFKWKHGS